jgi:hypothetical protein
MIVKHDGYKTEDMSKHVEMLKNNGCTIWCKCCGSGMDKLKKIWSYEDDQEIFVCPNCEMDDLATI